MGGRSDNILFIQQKKKKKNKKTTYSQWWNLNTSNNNESSCILIATYPLKEEKPVRFLSYKLSGKWPIALFFGKMHSVSL